MNRRNLMFLTAGIGALAAAIPTPLRWVGRSGLRFAAWDAAAPLSARLPVTCSSTSSTGLPARHRTGEVDRVPRRGRPSRTRFWDRPRTWVSTPTTVSTSSLTATRISSSVPRKDSKGKFVSGKLRQHLRRRNQPHLRSPGEVRLPDQRLPGPHGGCSTTIPCVGGEVDLVEWYGNNDWPSGTTVHARAGRYVVRHQSPPHRQRVAYLAHDVAPVRDVLLEGLQQPGMEPFFEGARELHCGLAVQRSRAT